MSHFDQVLLEVKKIANKYPHIEKIVLFGSRARGDFQPTSDIDLCIFGTEETATKFSVIAWEIEEIETYYSFDVLFFPFITNEKLRQEIESQGVVIA